MGGGGCIIHIAICIDSESHCVKHFSQVFMGAYHS